VLLELLVWTFLVLGGLALIANGLSLVQGLRFRGHVRRALRMALGAFLPRAAVLLPVRGTDDGFDANLRAILEQAYPSYRLVVVADAADDEGLDRARSVAPGHPTRRVDTIVAWPSTLGGKVNALRTGLSHLEPDDEVVVFADADIRPGPDWLRQLVQPLADVTVGASTGFRWYVPPDPGFWALVRSEWNAVSANVLFDPERNYVWGGSCAVRREHLPRLRLPERWREVLSDDLVLTRAVREEGLRIAYAPAALVPTLEGGDRAGCVEWCLRQMTMAVLYQPELRKYAAAAFGVFNGAVVLGLIAVVLGFLLDRSFLGPAALLLATVPATAAKAALRRRAFLSASPAVDGAWHVPAWRSSLAAVAVPWLMMWGLLRTRHPDVVRWRGRVYDVRDPDRVRLLEDGPPAKPG